MIKKYDLDFELHLMTIEEGDAGVLKGIKQEEHTYESIKMAWMMCWIGSC